jgi:hypothetical protein
MIIKFALADELASSMEHELKPFEEKTVPQNLAQAVECLHAAAEIFEEAGLTKRADQVLDILEKLAAGKTKMHTNMIANLPPVGKMMQMGVTLADFEKMNRGDLRAKAKVNKILYQLGLDPRQIAQAIGIGNVMSLTDAEAFGNPHSSSSAILRMIENPFAAAPSKNLEEGDEIAIESLASKHKKIKDPHTKGLTPEKMVKNLLNHGTEFNMADDSKADDLLNLDISDADLEVLENEALSEMDFEDEI